MTMEFKGHLGPWVMKARGAPGETQGRLGPRDLMEKWVHQEIEVSLVLMDFLVKRGHRASAACLVQQGLKDWTETQDATENQV